MYRERRQQAADFFIKMVHEHRKACELISQIQLIMIMKKLQVDVNIELQRRDKMRKEQYIYNRICFLFKTEYCRFNGGDQRERFGR